MENVWEQLCDKCTSDEVDEPNENVKENILHTAVTSKHDDCMNVLIKAGAGVNWADDSFHTLLMTAVSHCYSKGVQRLLEAGADVNIKDRDGCTALTIAGFNGHDQCLQLLLNAGADVNTTTSCTDGNYTPLYGAVISKNIKCVELLLNSGADINIKTTYDSSVISIASYHGSTDIVKLLLKAGANVNYSRMLYYDRTNLMEAAGNGHYDIMKVLIKEGADVNGNGRDSTPVIDVIRMKTKGESRIVDSTKRKKCIKLLLQAGADVNEEGRENIRGITALSIASRNGLNQEVEYLIQAGAYVNRVPDGGTTALVEASRKHNVNTPVNYYVICLKLLIKAGADVNLMIPDGPSALFAASRNGFDEGIELLIQAGADVNMVLDLNDQTALMVATMNRHVKCVELLIESGADVNLNNSDGLTALMYAYTRSPSLEYGEKNGRSRELKETFDQLDHLGCAKILLLSGVKINLKDKLSRNALHHQVAKHDGSKKIDDICRLLFAAGETLDGISDEKIPDCLKFEDLQLELKHICREATRKHLLSLDPHSHLFFRIPLLGLPSSLTEYLLYDTSL